MRHRKGVFTWANGQRYSGDWVQDFPTGQASLQFVGGNYYEGGISLGEPRGAGRMRYASGDAYTGQFNAGFPEGKGLYVWKMASSSMASGKTGSSTGRAA